MEGLDFFSPLPVDSRETLADITADKLRDAIRSGRLKPGIRLIEREIAERLKISRVPVREAIQRLTEEGLLKKVPRHGAFVCAPTLKEIEEIASLRTLLEQFAVERVLENWDARYGIRLRWIIDDMTSAIANDDYSRVFEMDREFHLTLWKFANHSLLVEVSASLRERIALFLQQAVSAQKETPLFDRYASEHTRLVEAMESGDLPRAKSVIANHIERAMNQIIRLHGLTSVVDDTYHAETD